MTFEEHMDQVRLAARTALEKTSLRPVVSQHAALLYGGKMLRARLAMRVGLAGGVPLRTLIPGCAAIELLHAASLLHDDVIDGATLRRGVPTFWVSRSTSGAILLGDLMVCTALSLLVEADNGDLIAEFAARSREMCEAEVEQELLRRGEADWETSVSLARRKTGSLFAFVAYLGGAHLPDLRAALRESGYLVGTAYQLADDVFDSFGDPGAADKSVGLDAARSKVTAVSGWRNPRGGSPEDPIEYIVELCERSEDRLAEWPAVQAAWREFLASDLNPSIQKLVQLFVPLFAAGQAAAV